MFNRQRCSLHVSAGALAVLALGWLLATAAPAEAGCWRGSWPVCQLVSFYAITYNGGPCGGSYDLAFTSKYSFFPGVCGNGGAEFWSMSDGGTGYNAEINVVRVFPNDPYCSRSNPFTAYIKVKAYDLNGNPLRTGSGPDPYFINPKQFVKPGDTIRVSCQ